MIRPVYHRRSPFQVSTVEPRASMTVSTLPPAGEPGKKMVVPLLQLNMKLEQSKV
jgi:hypothetical protein